METIDGKLYVLTPWGMFFMPERRKIKRDLSYLIKQFERLQEQSQEVPRSFLA